MPQMRTANRQFPMPELRVSGNAEDEGIIETDLFDLYYLLKRPMIIKFMYNDNEYEIQSVQDDNGVHINFCNQWYRTPEELLWNAIIDNRRLVDHFKETEGFVII